MVTIPAQFNGPDRSGNGGWVCGLLASELHEVAGHHRELDRPVTTSTLRLPPPLDTPLAWEHDERGIRLLTHGGALIGEAAPGEFARPAPRAAEAGEAEAGLRAYPGFEHHPFDRCFTCGTAREEGDGLRLFTGPVAEGRTAGPWHAHPALAGADGLMPLPVVWAALDCPGGWAADFTAQPMVLGRMTAEVLQPVEAGQTLHAVGELHTREGRKFHTSTALHSVDGELIGRAEQIWFEVDLAGFS